MLFTTLRLTIKHLITYNNLIATLIKAETYATFTAPSRVFVVQKSLHIKLSYLYQLIEQNKTFAFYLEQTILYSKFVVANKMASF